MPELPEVEIAARRVGAAVTGARVESALAPGMVTMKTFDPPLDALVGTEITGVRRRGKMFVVEAGGLALLIHLMSAGRLQVWDKRASLRDKASRLLVRLEDGRELRLREFGTQQRAWAKLMDAGAVEQDDAVATLGPEAWPQLVRPRSSRRWWTSPATCTRCCATSARSRASGARGWTRSCGRAELSPFKKGSELDEAETERLRLAVGERLGAALDHYEEVIGPTVPDKLPMPLLVHRRSGEPCPRCGTTIEAIHFKDYVMCYCPKEQTGGRVLKDRRLSRLLK